MATIKHSRQRDAIKNFLMSRKDHPTAEVVYSHVIKDFPNISLGSLQKSFFSCRKRSGDKGTMQRWFRTF